MLSISYNFTSVKWFELWNVNTKKKFAFPAVDLLPIFHVTMQEVSLAVLKELSSGAFYSVCFCWFGFSFNLQRLFGIGP